MHPLLKIFLIGTGISFLGALPLGTMNVMATQISVRDGEKAAFLFASAAVIIEMAYARIALVAMSWISRQQKLFILFEWLTVLILLALATGSFIAAIHKTGLGRAMPVHQASPILLGIVLSATNPLHITFWFGWSTVLMQKGILHARNKDYNVYTTGIGIGSILGFAVFIVGGMYLVEELKTNQDILNWIIGAVLAITAVIQTYKIITKPSPLIRANPPAAKPGVSSDPGQTSDLDTR